MEAQRELRRRDRLERDLKEAKALVEQKSIELKNLQQNFEKAKNDIGKYESQMKDQKGVLERTQKDLDIVNQRFQKINQDYESLINQNNGLANENALKCHELKVSHFLNCKSVGFTTVA